MEHTPHPLTLTVEQAAKVLGIGRSTAYELVHTGAIPSLRLGRRIVVPVGQLADRLGVPPDAFCSEPTKESTSPGSSRTRVAVEGGVGPSKSEPASLF